MLWLAVFYFFLLNIMEQHSTTLTRVAEWFRYLVRFASLIGMIISSSILIYTIASSILISEDEYITSRYWDIQQCDQPTYQGEKTIARSADEIVTCKKDARERTLLTRQYDSKTTAIGSLSRLFVCTVVYFLFWKFYRKESH